MIEIYTGIPGSGKTYRAVSYLYDIFIDSKSKDFGKFQKFFTNINEFNFSVFPENTGYPLDFDKLLSGLDKLHRAYMKKISDTDLNELAESLNLKDSFFVIDEAHNHFDKNKPVLVWWLSYHRHLHQNIILITQNLSLIDSKYKSFSEHFYKAVPSSLRIFSGSFKYVQYIGSRMYKNEVSGKFSLKFNKEIYALYHSGDNTQSQKVIYKYLSLAGGALVLAIFVIYLIVHFMFSKSDKSKDITNEKNITRASFSPQNIDSKSMVKTDISSFNFFITFICQNDICSYNGDEYSTDQIKFFIDKYKLLRISSKHLSQAVYIYKYSAPDDKFQKALYYE